MKVPVHPDDCHHTAAPGGRTTFIAGKDDGSSLLHIQRRGESGNSLSGGKPLNVRQEFESVVNCGIIEQFFMGKAPPYARGRVFENKNSIHKNRNYY